MRKLAWVFLLLLATRVWAYRGRPVSGLRFEGQPYVYATALASDGSGFMALLGNDSGASARTFVQKIGPAGTPIGPQRQVGLGEPAGLVWMGSDYLAAWKTSEGLWVGAVSRDGSPRSEPAAPVLVAERGFFAANGQSVLGFGYSERNLKVQPLDATGQAQGTARTYVVPAARANFTVAPTPGGFTAVYSGYSGTWMQRFTLDGNAFEPVLLDGPYGGSASDYHSNGAAIASDGTETLVVFGSGRYGHDAHLRSVTIGADGNAKRSGVIYELPLRGDFGIVPVHLGWNGTEYVAALNLRQSDNPAQSEYAGVLLRIHRTGERDGEPQFVGEQQQVLRTLAWNGRTFLSAFHRSQPYGTFVMTIDPATGRTSVPVKLGNTASLHGIFAIEAGHGGYLAAWLEHDRTQTTVRASRIDRNGNYLDEEGIVLDTLPVSGPNTEGFFRHMAIDGSGPQWLVVWAQGGIARARAVSLNGTPAGTSAFTIGAGREVAVRWGGQYYVVLRTDIGHSLHRDRVTANGNVLETKVVAAAYEDVADDSSVTYFQPSLVRLRDRVLAVFSEDETQNCWIPLSCQGEVRLLGMHVEEANAQPFLITGDALWGNPRVAASANEALVIWEKSPGLRYTFLSADAPEQPSAEGFVNTITSRPHVAFDGTNFVAVGHRYNPGSFVADLVSVPIDPRGTAGSPTVMPLDKGETLWNPLVAAGAGVPALIGYQDRHTAYDGAHQTMLLFASELGGEATTTPFAPEIICATENGDGTVTVRWRPVPNALGVSIELQLADGTFRPIGVASADATIAHASLAGLPHGAIRVRAWNAAGLSAPSSLAPSVPPPSAILRSTARACAGVPLNVNVTLRGSAPFTIRWSDGMVQSNVMSSSTSRTVTATENRTLKIVRVTDASCAANDEPETMRITVDPFPTVSVPESELRIARGATATLSVSSADAEDHAWYEGEPGDTSRPVGADAATFTTPPLQRSTRYWVRVSNRCGSADSAAIAVTVPAPKGRAVRH